MRKLNLDRNRILELHNDGLTDSQIATIFGCERSNITYHLNKMGIFNRKSKINNIELRNRISNSLIGRYVGADNPNYKGYTEEKTIARGLFKTISKRKIRDNGFKCQHCSKVGDSLETHHIKPFYLILEEFISTSYSGNIQTIYDELMNYRDFINEENMVVLCKDCHHRVHYSDDHELSPYRWESATTIESIAEEKTHCE